jgi:hypothetical protein
VKKLMLIAAVPALAFAWLFAASCSNPLESTTPPEPQIVQATDSVTVFDTLTICDTVFVSDSVVRTDTVFVTDSVYFTDTVRVVDTVSRVDTLVLADTVVRVDTVVVTIPDPGNCPDLCSRLGSHQKEIVWLLFNDAGHFRLDFSALVEKDKPAQTLIIKAGGEVFRWKPSTGNEFSVEVNLDEHARIEVSLDNPRACGHSVDVCLRVTPL